MELYCNAIFRLRKLYTIGIDLFQTDARMIYIMVDDKSLFSQQLHLRL